MIEMQPLVDRW